jgi:hypothetical protein
VLALLREVRRGPSGRRPGGVHLLARPFLPALVRLLDRVPPWGGWRRFCASDEVMGPLIPGDVDVCLPEQLFGGDWRLLEYGSDKGRVIGSPIEVFNYGRLSDFEDAVYHCLNSFEERSEGLIILAPDGFEVPWLRRLIGERQKVHNKPETEVTPIVDAVSWQVSKPLQRALP